MTMSSTVLKLEPLDDQGPTSEASELPCEMQRCQFWQAEGCSDRCIIAAESIPFGPVNTIVPISVSLTNIITGQQPVCGLRFENFRLDPRVLLRRHLFVLTRLVLLARHPQTTNIDIVIENA